MSTGRFSVVFWESPHHAHTSSLYNHQSPRPRIQSAHKMDLLSIYPLKSRCVCPHARKHAPRCRILCNCKIEAQQKGDCLRYSEDCSSISPLFGWKQDLCTVPYSLPWCPFYRSNSSIQSGSECDIQLHRIRSFQCSSLRRSHTPEATAHSRDDVIGVYTYHLASVISTQMLRSRAAVWEVLGLEGTVPTMAKQLPKTAVIHTADACSLFNTSASTPHSTLTSGFRLPRTCTCQLLLPG